MPEPVQEQLDQMMAMMCQCDYIDPAEAEHIPTHSGKRTGILYGPLAAHPAPPEVVLLWLTPRQAMLCNEAGRRRQSVHRKPAPHHRQARLRRAAAGHAQRRTGHLPGLHRYAHLHRNRRRPHAEWPSRDVDPVFGDAEGQELVGLDNDVLLVGRAAGVADAGSVTSSPAPSPPTPGRRTIRGSPARSRANQKRGRSACTGWTLLNLLAERVAVLGPPCGLVWALRQAGARRRGWRACPRPRGASAPASGRTSLWSPARRARRELAR
ncbi:hypothetical protein [Nonomuraea fuscirosea]|uniref:hypothetical protein n=1 Tax=Nonomuraea fuscirosea TaxID=1291556 RepID=UPI003404EDD9